MKALVVGGGGREHAIAWALAKSPRVARVFVAPGNAGTAREHGCENAPIRADDVAALTAFARNEGMGIVIIGPEAPLAAGLADALAEAGVRAFGPSRAAAQLEASKAFAKQIMRESGIATADFAVCRDSADALDFIHDKPFRNPGFVVKADGLAAGKGVVMCANATEAEQAVRALLVDRAFGSASDTIVIEERLVGREVSVLAFTDGHTVAVMPPARDHKRAFDDDLGPNTGGMGAYAPVPDVDGAQLDAIAREVLQPAVDAMRERGTPYVGVLYAGLMLTEHGLRVLEFNCRFGDPETQALLPLLSTDLVEIASACVDGRLGGVRIDWRSGACASIVLASGGYPGAYQTGLPIDFGDSASDGDDTLVFHAGTALNSDGRTVTAGGRVLAVSAVGADLDAALQRAYGRAARIRFEDAHYRTDIGVLH